MHRVARVAWRDFKHTVMTRAFLFGVVGVPILILVVGGIALLIMMRHEEPPLVGRVAVIASSEDVATAVQREFDKAREGADVDVTDRMSGFDRGTVDLTVEPIIAPLEQIPADVKGRIERGDLIAAAVVPTSVLETPEPGSSSGDGPRFRLLVADETDSDHVGLIERRIAQAIVDVRARRAGEDPAALASLLRQPESDTSKLLEGGEEKSEGELVRELRQVVPIVFLMLLWGAAFSSGQQLLMTTIEEKSNRVMEVLLSAVSPMHLMTGKILGQGLAGLIVVAVYSSVGIAGLIAARSVDLVSSEQLLYFVIFFFMAYFMVAALMAAVGSAVSELREANSLMMPVMMLLMLPLFLWMPISQAPNGGIATAFSFIPPAIPFVMVIRVAAEEPVPGWQIASTIGWGVVCTVLMMWMASRIFRVGVLMYGKPPSPLELIKWLRYS